jgi:very-short-patch-repair endonuclease
MRASLTPSEAALWAAIRGNQLGVRFRRQVVIGSSFIADFAAPSVRVVVEVDGGYHTERRAADARRDRKLRRLGWRVVRLDARLVVERLSEAVARIRAMLGQGC